jgi:hypothetical protein
MRAVYKRFVLCCIVGAGFIVACAIAAPKEPPPLSGQASSEHVLTRHPSDEEKWAGYSVPESYFGVTTSSRGSLLAGLLLGPLGVAANVASAKSESERQATPLKSLLSEDLRKALIAQATNAVPDEAASIPRRHFALIPSAALDFRSDEQFRLRCALNAALVEDGKVVWRSRYLLQVEGMFVRTAPEDVAKAASELGPCLGRAYVLFQKHKANQLGPFKEYSVKADYNLNVPVLESVLPDRIIYSDHLGLFEYRKSDVRSITPR